MLQRKLGKNKFFELRGYTPPYTVTVCRRYPKTTHMPSGKIVKSEILSKQFSDFSKAAQYIHILRQFAYGRSVKPMFDVPLFSRISTLRPDQHLYIYQKPTLSKLKAAKKNSI